jgi:AraC-like DNA-binding protein
MTFIRGGLKLIVQAARGEHQTQILTWQTGMTPLLDHWIVTRTGTRQSLPPGAAAPRQVGCKPIDPHFQDALARYEEAKRGAVEYAEPLMLSVIYEIAARLMVGLDEVQLAAIPITLPETIRELTVRVRQNAALPWPLKEAADAAGYSPFHFSRVFKSLVGYGFHEYVDRCRTECAVEMLCTTDSPVDIVASTCGFGTTQGLRESVKEYLGLVPSELRSVPDTADLAID